MRKALIALTIVSCTTIGMRAAGTALSLTFDDPLIECPGGNVTMAYTLSSIAASETTVTETLTKSGGAPVVTGYTVPAGNVSGGWVFAGRTKTFDGVYHAAGLSNGNYQLEICATQPGAGGNPDKTVCRTQSFTIDCSVADDGNPCNDSAPFGEVTGNTQIRENATAQIQFRGDFGATALVEISLNGTSVGTAVVGRNGDSCNYHANWKFTTPEGADLFGNAGPGNYTVKVSGNGNELEFGVTLVAAAN